jgi:2-desacetyl-2-hydroxyethyl bacteriochlorophyllide A dehydrogenase
MGQMKAFVKVRPEPGGVEYLDWDVPSIGGGDVLIQVKAAGLCGTDMHLYEWPDSIVREYKPKLPVVMGHEFSGVVAEVGSKVKNVKTGDRVTVNPLLYCEGCYFCKNGKQNICDNRPLLGLGVNGAFAESVAVRSSNVYRMDDAVPFEVGALSELTCVGLHAIERARLTGGDTVAVVGAGPLGFIMAVLAKHSGAVRVFVTGLEADRERLELAGKIGAIPIMVEREDPREQILEYTDGLGADVVFETAGAPSGVTQSLSLVRKAGRVGILGQGHESTEILTAMLSFREIEMVGTRAYTPREWQRVSAMLRNAQHDLNQVITHRLPLEKAEEGIRLMEKREGLKVIVEP